IEPGAHAVLPLTEEVYQAHAGRPGQGVEYVDLGVVTQVKRVIAAVRGNQVDSQEDVGRLHLDVDPLLVHALGQLRHGELHAGLYEHQGHVNVRADLEADRQRIVAVVGAGGGHVDHAFDAVDLFLDRLGNGFRHGLGARARIAGGHQ